MKLLILIDSPLRGLSFVSDTLAATVPYPGSVQVIPVCDVSQAEWDWAEWVMIGFSCTGDKPSIELEQFLGTLPASRVERKGLAIFQVQSRADAPITAAYGFGLARTLRKRGMHLFALPMVFFFERDNWSETEGELLRATQWLAEIAKHQVQQRQNG